MNLVSLSIHELKISPAGRNDNIRLILSEQVIGLLGYWVIGLLGYWVIGLLGYWVIGLLGYWVIGLLGYWVIGNSVDYLILAWQSKISNSYQCLFTEHSQKEHSEL
jgi:hypothetical protein